MGRRPPGFFWLFAIPHSRACQQQAGQQALRDPRSISCSILVGENTVSGDGLMANVSRRYETFLRKRVHHTNTSSMSGGSTTSLFYRYLGLSREEARRLWAKILGAEPAVFPCLDLIICAICRSLRTAVWECSASETERRPDRTRSKTDRSTSLLTSLGSRKPRVRGREIPPPPRFLYTHTHTPE